MYDAFYVEIEGKKKNPHLIGSYEFLLDAFANVKLYYQKGKFRDGAYFKIVSSKGEDDFSIRYCFNEFGHRQYIYND